MMMARASMTKRGTFGIDEKVLITIVRAAELFKRRSSSIFSAYGISFSQYNALRVLEISMGGQKSISDISRQMLISAPNMSGIAKRMEKAGFVRRGRDPKDERKAILRITAKGRQVLAQIEDLQRANIREILDPCPAPLKEPMLEALKAVLAGG